MECCSDWTELNCRKWLQCESAKKTALPPHWKQENRQRHTLRYKPTDTTADPFSIVSLRASTTASLQFGQSFCSMITICLMKVHVADSSSELSFFKSRLKNTIKKKWQFFVCGIVWWIDKNALKVSNSFLTRKRSHVYSKLSTIKWIK